MIVEFSCVGSGWPELMDTEVVMVVEGRGGESKGLWRGSFVGCFF